MPREFSSPDPEKLPEHPEINDLARNVQAVWGEIPEDEMAHDILDRPQIEVVDINNNRVIVTRDNSDMFSLLLQASPEAWFRLWLTTADDGSPLTFGRFEDAEGYAYDPDSLEQITLIANRRLSEGIVIDKNIRRAIEDTVPESSLEGERTRPFIKLSNSIWEEHRDRIRLDGDKYRISITKDSFSQNRKIHCLLTKESTDSRPSALFVLEAYDESPPEELYVSPINDYVIFTCGKDHNPNYLNGPQRDQLLEEIHLAFLIEQENDQ